MQTEVFSPNFRISKESHCTNKHTPISGIGKGLIAKYLGRPNHTVVAAVRDPYHSSSKSLSDLAVGDNSSLIVIPFDSSSEKSINEAINTLKVQYSITSLSIVIANAGMVEFYGTVLQTPI